MGAVMSYVKPVSPGWLRSLLLPPMPCSRITTGTSGSGTSAGPIADTVSWCLMLLLSVHVAVSVARVIAMAYPFRYPVADEAAAPWERAASW